MNEKNYQKLAELIDRAPRLLGPGGLFGGLNQEHGLMVDFVKFVRGLALGNRMSPETVNIGNFVTYLGERKNAEDVARKLYDMRQDGEIVEDIHSRERNTLFNLAETLIDLGVGENPENVGADYEGVLRGVLAGRAAARAGATRSGADRAGASPKGERRLNKQKKGGVKIDETVSAAESAGPKGTTPQGTAPVPGRDVTSPEKPLSTMGESLTDEVSIAQGEEDQAGVLAVGAETQTGAIASASAIGAEMQAAQLNLQPTTSDTGNLPITEDQQQASDILPQTVSEGDEGNLQSEAAEISGLLRPLTAPIIGEAVGGVGQVAGQSAGERAGQATGRQGAGAAAGQATGRQGAGAAASQATGEALAGTRAAPGGERRRIVAELPGEGRGRMLQKGPKKQKQGQGREQGRGTGESGQDQGRQTGPGRNPAQNFADSQAAQPQKSGVGGKVAGGAGAGIAGLALIKGMYGGAAANAASFGILQTILDLLT